MIMSKTKIILEIEIDMNGDESAARLDVTRNIRNMFVGKYGSGLNFDYVVCDVMPYVSPEVTKLLAEMKVKREKSK